MEAKWIWAHKREQVYNETIVARRSVTLMSVRQATVRVTADSFYRLFINGNWVADGPCRSWPSHFQYDVIDTTGYLQDGVNEIEIVARHYGVGDLHGVYQRPGLLFEMDVQLTNGKNKKVISDKFWQTAVARQWISTTAKIAIQMEPSEMVDARLDKKFRLTAAKELYDAHEGPWKNLLPRDVAMLSRKPFAFKRYVGARVVRSDARVFCVPAARLCNPGIVASNGYVGAACGMAAEITVRRKTVIRLEAPRWVVTVDGRKHSANRFTLAPGQHFILALSDRVATMHCQDKNLAIISDDSYSLSNPLDSHYENPWTWIRFSEHHFCKDDLHAMWADRPEPEVRAIEQQYEQCRQSVLKQISGRKKFISELGDRASLLPSGKMFVEDTAWDFQHRRVMPEAPEVANGKACISTGPEVTFVKPAQTGDVELCYDLGEQNLGCWQFELDADKDVVVDFFGVEHLFKDGRPQHTLLNRNGLRYITRQGKNRFTSLKMRSGRYLFVTLRNFKSPVRIQHLAMAEMTYPVDARTSFQCSGPHLERIWDICERTVKLCMTDTYIDCPLYEQTLWVGDARNESLFGYLLFGAEDLARRCIRLAAESLERFPIVGCQVPSSWDCLLPGWSFLWGISVWEYYWQTGDKKFLEEYWPAVQKNLKGAYTFINEDGLYSAPHWNLFDWSGIDQNQNTVLHNTMLLVGALQAAVKCAVALGQRAQAKQWKREAEMLKGILNSYWNKDRKTYPDSIHADSRISDSMCQHTSFLSLLYGIAGPSFVNDCLANTLDPPKQMVRVGSPFAIFYLYECWEKMGLYNEIMKSILQNYIPMLEAGATTAWECFPGNSMTDELTDGGPTRSHCHAWSSAPVYFISRILLGIRQTKPGGKAFEISPWVKDLQWARGTVLSHQGPIRVDWKREGKKLFVDFQCPLGVCLNFVGNASHKGLNVIVSGNQVTNGNG